MTNQNDIQSVLLERGDAMILLECKVFCNWYAVVCCMCKKTMELKGTDEPHMMMDTSHTYCEVCQVIMMKEVDAYLASSKV